MHNLCTRLNPIFDSSHLLYCEFSLSEFLIFASVLIGRLLSSTENELSSFMSAASIYALMDLATNLLLANASMDA